ncbi:nitroreductase family protein [Pseudooceanicola sp. CBS1P-1]|uniref:NAD(P)H-dependent oxidoreductase n=1 Tax=Pseudooceanicola albus TaxID=2692189 RepID=A0A6L7G2Y6_9RHOB|nr:MULTISPECIES: nitroreductase family protein [Pseudooceanicola]MBT9384567.1 nitroreductase family protein [Pseudooceanicola endophyticus]MXN18269.1 NAD(P)H-dependent oxidoreductase [Pseudooceanicola albus]
MFLDRLNWRYATKKMDPSRPVPEEKIAQILEAIRMAPTSSGIQAFRVFLIRDPELRARLRPAAMDQPQVTECSHLLVFAAWDDFTEARIDDTVADIEAARGKSEGITLYYDRLKERLLSRDTEANFAHAANQAFIGLGFALAAAAELEVDSTPMGGFDAATVDEILGLRAQGLRSVVLLPLGTRDTEGDWLYPMAKVRKPMSEFVTEIG